MSDEVLHELAHPEARLAGARSRTFRVFAEAFGYAEDALQEAVRSRALAEALGETLAALDPGLAREVDWEALADAGRNDDLAVEYTRLFEVGLGGPPCPLYGGLYTGARLKIMEEAVRFYNHFGLTMAESPRELPDHLTTELEFLHYLAFREAEALERGDDPDPFRRAQRDFVVRHPGRWVPKLRVRLAKHAPMPFFRELVCQLERFLEHEKERLVAQVGPAPEASAPPSSATN